jgi:CRP/FNR family cyclic AMP-dependent transcriptional regulator
MDRRVLILSEHPFLSGLGDGALATIAGCGEEKAYDAGAFLMREGDDAHEFFLVRAGRVALEIHVPGQGALAVESIVAGDVVGLSWLFPPMRVHLDARAIEPVSSFAFDTDRLRSVMGSDPEVGYALSQRLLRAMWDRLERVRLQRLDVYRNGA